MVEAPKLKPMSRPFPWLQDISMLATCHNYVVVALDQIVIFLGKNQDQIVTINDPKFVPICQHCGATKHTCPICLKSKSKRSLS